MKPEYIITESDDGNRHLCVHFADEASGDQFYGRVATFNNVGSFTPAEQQELVDKLNAA